MTNTFSHRVANGISPMLDTVWHMYTKITASVSFLLFKYDGDTLTVSRSYSLTTIERLKVRSSPHCMKLCSSLQVLVMCINPGVKLGLE